MKAISIYCLCLFICIAFGQYHHRATPAPTQTPAPALNDPNWRLTWSDEFNSLDTTKWNIRDKSGNYGNGELQWYSPEQVYVSNGLLVINASKESYAGEQYVSGWLDSQDKAMFTQGRYEINAKMAPGYGTWPALWLLSQTKCWAFGQEVDIAEFIGKNPDYMGQYLHYSDECEQIYDSSIQSQGSQVNAGVDLTAGFHTYSFTWIDGSMNWYIDGSLKTTFKTSILKYQPIDMSPHYWILNLAIGGGYPSDPTGSTVFPTFQYVDWVRNYVYRKTCAGETCSNNGCCNTTSLLCQCNSGWTGSECEQSVQSHQETYDQNSNLVDYPSGWGTPYTMYSTANSVYSNGQLGLVLSNAGCPGSCFGASYASGAWESIPRFGYGNFTFRAIASAVSGTALTMSAAGESSSLEQAAFIIYGEAPTQVQLMTWHNNWNDPLETINLGFDASKGWHSYTFIYSASNILWYVDNVLVANTNTNQPTAVRLGPGVYYTMDSDWYGPFTYTGPSYANVTEFDWTITPNLYTAHC